MKITFQRLPLRTRHVFRIAGHEAQAYENVLVRLTHEGTTGIGEAAPAPFYGENVLTVEAALQTFPAGSLADPFRVEELEAGWEHALSGNPSAKAALDIALHDWLGKRLGLPLYRLWGLDPTGTPLTSFTIGLDEIPRMVAKVREAKPYPILKIKVGTARDLETLQAIRQVTDKPIRVDANGVWSPKEAVRRIRALEPLGIEFVEQPVPGHDLPGLRYLRERVDTPIIADESCLRATDIPPLVGAVDGINIKLMKSGGLREALRMIHVARAHGMRVMLGCMIESSLAITAAAHLSPLADYADLDGHLLLAEDPFQGVEVRAGRLILPQRPGLGVVERRRGRKPPRK